MYAKDLTHTMGLSKRDVNWNELTSITRAPPSSYLVAFKPKSACLLHPESRWRRGRLVCMEAGDWEAP